MPLEPSRKGHAGPDDLKIGERVRQARTLKRVSQEHLAEELGITFQQIQKYEWGQNRIAATRLVGISRALDMPVGYLLQDVITPEEWGAPTDMVRVFGRLRTEDLLLLEHHQNTTPRLRECLRLITEALAEATEHRSANPG